jgi:hypothetical protein
MQSEAAVRRAFQKAIEQSLPQQELRYLRAWRLISDGHVRLREWSRNHCVAEVASGSEAGVLHDVVRDPRKGWACTCKDFDIHGGRRDFICKHIMAVSWVWGSAREGVRE